MHDFKILFSTILNAGFIFMIILIVSGISDKVIDYWWERLGKKNSKEKENND